MPSLANAAALCSGIGLPSMRISPGGESAEAGENFAELALAIARNAGDAENLAGMEVEIDVLQSRDAALVAAGHAPQRQDRRLRRGRRRATLLMIVAKDDFSPDHQPRQHAMIAIDRVLGRDLLPTAEDGDAIGDLENLVELVADEDDGVAAGAKVAERVKKLLRLGRGQHRGRLVEDQDARVARRARGGSRPAAARRRKGPRRGRRGSTARLNFAREQPRARLELAGRRPHRGLVPAKVDVFRDREGAHQLEVLVNHPDAGGNRVDRRGEGDRVAVDDDLTGIRPIEAGENVHERRFAGAVLAEERVDFAAPHFQIDAGIGEHAGERLGDAAEDDARRRPRRQRHRGLDCTLHRARAWLFRTSFRR